MMLKSIRKYFACYTAHEAYPLISEMLLDIQDEVDSSYMELPVDADGVPIHCGERMRLDNGHEGDVWLVGVFDIMMSDHTCFDWAKSRHVKQRTVEDVLKEFGDWYKHVAGGCDEPGIIAKYADELRSMGVVE